MALTEPDFYPGPALIVGDGNFSFSLCLAKALVHKSINICATSLDTKEQLETNSLALENLKELSSFPNVQVLHGLDATELDRTFKSRLFQRIIFNFPHTGGKIKISNCRKLLEEFFVCAVRQLEPLTGVVCVSLCQGQGGTPEDTIQREYGNTWQIVDQAAKAGLILNAIHPFRRSTYPGYNSAGFKGNLGKGFHTSGGLTHMFVHGMPLVHVPPPDIISSLDRMKDCSSEFTGMHVNPNHPIGILKTNVENHFKDLFITGTISERFEILQEGYCEFVHVPKTRKLLLNETCSSNSSQGSCDMCWRTTDGEMKSSMDGCSSSHVRTTCAVDIPNSSSEMVCTNPDPISRSSFSFLGNVLQYLQNNHTAFIISGTEINSTFPVTASTYPVTHKVVITRTVTTGTSNEELSTELDIACKSLITNVCAGMVFTAKPNQEGTEEFDLDFSKCQLNLFKPNDYQALRQRRRNPYEWRTENLPTSKACMPAQCSCLDNDTNGIKCTYCKMEVKYLSQKQGNCLEDLTDSKSRKELYSGEVLVISYGLLNLDLIEGDLPSARSGWVILVHLDALVMALHNIRDVRMLWSREERLLQQFLDPHKNSQPTVKFSPYFSLYPPIYIHDISFWLNENSTEERFFMAIHQVTQNCVCDIWFRERYIDKETCRVSYNYRMVYSRCDGSLSHLQTVEMQNLLRRMLLQMNFQLT